MEEEPGELPLALAAKAGARLENLVAELLLLEQLQILAAVGAVLAIHQPIGEMGAPVVPALLLSAMQTHIHLQSPPVVPRLPSLVVTASTLSQGLGVLPSNGTLCTGKRKLDC